MWHLNTVKYTFPLNKNNFNHFKMPHKQNKNPSVDCYPPLWYPFDHWAPTLTEMAMQLQLEPGSLVFTADRSAIIRSMFAALLLIQTIVLPSCCLPLEPTIKLNQHIYTYYHPTSLSTDNVEYSRLNWNYSSVLFCTVKSQQNHF